MCELQMLQGLCIRALGASTGCILKRWRAKPGCSVVRVWDTYLKGEGCIDSQVVREVGALKQFI